MRNNLFTRISAAHLRRAANLREKIESMESELASLLGIPEQATLGNLHRKRRRMTAAARKKISAAAKARWAKVRAGRQQ
jgi:hypothetical protein